MDAIQVRPIGGQSEDPRTDSDYFDGLPWGLVEAQLIEAEQDAVRVGSFLNAFMDALAQEYPGQVEPAVWRTMFSAKVLLELAAALRILAWEQEGLVRQDMGLPDGNEGITQVLLTAANDELLPNPSLKLVKVFAENFAWHARRDLGVYVLLGTIDVNEDELVDYMAHFLLQQLRQLNEND